ncbi:hypothetical protein L1987_18232 [Smallanthus sonchifolius]|uniref:Uncharacterized protein n=1 Tax=Smallanthus sonchifolius TaxID=185202 RepID=A0ACB9J2M3_9ASTR|nr:hypothetical protein L1987_18232 [Smallanthus sonchifolius]
MYLICQFRVLGVDPLLGCGVDGKGEDRGGRHRRRTTFRAFDSRTHLQSGSRHGRIAIEMEMFERDLERGYGLSKRKEVVLGQVVASDDDDLILPDQDFAKYAHIPNLQKVYVKFGALFRVSRKPFPYKDLSPLLSQVISSFGANHVMWGSDKKKELLNISILLHVG